MRLVLLAACLLLAPAFILVPASAESCSFSQKEARVLPNTNYWVSLDRSSCQAGSGYIYHRESVLITEGNPNAVDHVKLFWVSYFSSRMTPGDSSAWAFDAVSVQYRQQAVNASFQGNRDALGFTTCEVKLAYSDPPQTTTFGTGRMNVCPPPELTYI